MMKHVIILVILLVISFRLTKNTGGGGNLSLTLTPEIMSLRP